MRTASCGSVCYPTSDRPGDVAAAREQMFACPEGFHGFSHMQGGTPANTRRIYEQQDLFRIIQLTYDTIFDTITNKRRK